MTYETILDGIARLQSVLDSTLLAVAAVLVCQLVIHTLYGQRCCLKIAVHSLAVD
jgi:hypothetical protein